MHAIIAFLKDAVTRTPNGGITSCYIVREGSIYARNQALQAGVAMDSEVAFSVPADELDAALARMQQVESITVEEGSIQLKAGRLRATIKLNQDEPPPLPLMPTRWLPCPKNLVEALALARPFIGERGWSQGIRLMNGRVTAMCNIAGIDVVVDGLQLEPVLLPDITAAFLIAQGAPSEYAAADGSLTFRWPDGRWLRAQLLTDKMPDVDIILGPADSPCPVPITADWRQAYEDAAALSDGVISLTPDALLAARGAAHTRIEIQTPVHEGHLSHWTAKVIGPIIACAAEWNPAAYPQPAVFRAPGLRGVVMGIRR